MTSVPDTYIMQVNYYDNYSFKNKSPFNSGQYAYNATQTDFVDKRYGTDTNGSQGLLTGTITAMLDNPANKLYSVFYYDSKGNAIQSIASNHLGGYEKTYTNYSFSGQPTKMQHIHTKPNTTITEVYTYAYDHAGRSTTTQYKLDNNVAITLSEIVYDELGRVKQKKLHGNKETIAYNYNIRNWLKSINSTNFQQTLYYNEVYASNTKRYNGNISAQTWTGNRGYNYTYDNLNRLKMAQFMANGTAANNFTEEIEEYDKMGNIKKMKRYALNPTAATLVDNLTLTYTGNQLSTIVDAVSASTSLIGYVPPLTTPSGIAITYNKNGSMKQNFYSGIAGIAYNSLNLPDTIQFMYGHKTQYSYDAAGAKHKVVHTTVKSNLNVPLGQTVYTPNASQVQGTFTTDYCGNIVYEDAQWGNNPVRFVDPTGLAWKPTYDEDNDGKRTYNGYEWIPEDQSYDAYGNLLAGLYAQAIFFSDNGTFDTSDDHNIGSSTATVYLADGTTQAFDANTNPSSSDYATVPEGIYHATVGTHNGKKSSYTALKMKDTETTSNTIELGDTNPAHPERTYAEGIDIHKAGSNNLTGVDSKGNAISEGCLLIDVDNWSNFIGIFNTNEQRSKTVSVTVSRSKSVPVNANRLPAFNFFKSGTRRSFFSH
jgi:hypothetical protein